MGSAGAGTGVFPAPDGAIVFGTGVGDDGAKVGTIGSIGAPGALGAIGATGAIGAIEAIGPNALHSQTPISGEKRREGHISSGICPL